MPIGDSLNWDGTVSTKSMALLIQVTFEGNPNPTACSLTLTPAETGDMVPQDFANHWPGPPPDVSQINPTLQIGRVIFPANPKVEVIVVNGIELRLATRLPLIGTLGVTWT